MIRVLGHAPGPADHGVVRHARAIAELAAPHGVVTVATGPAELTHVQFTDRLFGPDIHTATAAFLDRAAAVPRPLVVTLHDLPGGDADRARDLRRCAGYAAVAAAADVVVVSSEHESRLAAGLDPRCCRVIPLPLPRLPGPRSVPGWSATPSVGVLGFLYPGKGHAEAIAAAARCRPAPRVVAAGGPAAGHGHLVSELRDLARGHGVELLVTGPLGDQELADAAAAVTVPIAPAHAVSASGSLLCWLAARRRPLAAAGGYTREVARRHPGSVTLYRDAAELDAALRRALADPATTRAAAVPAAPDAGAAHARLYRDLARTRC